MQQLHNTEIDNKMLSDILSTCNTLEWTGMLNDTIRSYLAIEFAKLSLDDLAFLHFNRLKQPNEYTVLVMVEMLIKSKKLDLAFELVERLPYMLPISQLIVALGENEPRIIRIMEHVMNLPREEHAPFCKGKLTYLIPLIVNRLVLHDQDSLCSETIAFIEQQVEEHPDIKISSTTTQEFVVLIHKVLQKMVFDHGQKPPSLNNVLFIIEHVHKMGEIVPVQSGIMIQLCMLLRDVKRATHYCNLVAEKVTTSQMIRKSAVFFKFFIEFTNNYSIRCGNVNQHAKQMIQTLFIRKNLASKEEIDAAILLADCIEITNRLKMRSTAELEAAILGRIHEEKIEPPYHSNVIIFTFYFLALHSEKTFAVACNIFKHINDAQTKNMVFLCRMKLNMLIGACKYSNNLSFIMGLYREFLSLSGFVKTSYHALPFYAHDVVLIKYYREGVASHFVQFMQKEYNLVQTRLHKNALELFDAAKTGRFAEANDIARNLLEKEQITIAVRYRYIWNEIARTAITVALHTMKPEYIETAIRIYKRIDLLGLIESLQHHVHMLQLLHRIESRAHMCFEVYNSILLDGHKPTAEVFAILEKAVQLIPMQQVHSKNSKGDKIMTKHEYLRFIHKEKINHLS